MEIADTSKNGQITEIAETLNNRHNKEDLINEAIETLIIEKLDVKAKPVTGETFIEAKEALTIPLATQPVLDPLNWKKD